MTGIDTNILIYSCDKSNPEKQDRALEVIARATDGVVLWQVACEFIAASRKLAPQGFSPVEAWARLADFLLILPLILPSREALERAQELHVKRQMDFWDAMILGSCIACGVKRLYSEDLPGGNVEGLEIMNPFA